MFSGRRTTIGMLNLDCGWVPFFKEQYECSIWIVDGFHSLRGTCDTRRVQVVILLICYVQAPLMFSLAFAYYGDLSAFISVAGKICVLRRN